MQTRWVILVAVLAAVFGGAVLPRLAAREAHADSGMERRQVEALDRIARSLEKIADGCR